MSAILTDRLLSLRASLSAAAFSPTPRLRAVVEFSLLIAAGAAGIGEG